MAYARFEVDSDLYIFRDMYNGAFSIHVAAWRVEQSGDNYKKIPIKNKNAGKVFTAATRAETLKLVLQLKKSGLRVLDYTINRLEDEIRAATSGKKRT